MMPADAHGSDAPVVPLSEATPWNGWPPLTGWKLPPMITRLPLPDTPMVLTRLSAEAVNVLSIAPVVVLTAPMRLRLALDRVEKSPPRYTRLAVAFSAGTEPLAWAVRGGMSEPLAALRAAARCLVVPLTVVNWPPM